MEPSFPSRVSVVGLGYVGLSLATAFGHKLCTTGFDIDLGRIEELRSGVDRNGEIMSSQLNLPLLSFTNEPAELFQTNFVIVAVPTPIDQAKRPDLSPLVAASKTIGKNLRKGSIIVYESTVYPGCTEEICQPILEQESGLKAGLDFYLGYSPERVNPGDPDHTLTSMAKVIAAQDLAALEIIAQVYAEVVKSSLHRAKDIRTAEAAKVIENIQRDLNIALMNELSMLFHRIGINTQDVLRAAESKWNFHPFRPGLVGGHCIPVDPYYLTHKAQEVGFHPETILAGRRINDAMGIYIAKETIKLLIRAGKPVHCSTVLVLGFSFKENVSDVRDTRVFDLVKELETYHSKVYVHDPLVRPEDFERFEINVMQDPFENGSRYDAVILAVPHNSFAERKPSDFKQLLRNDSGVLVDIKGVLKMNSVNSNKILYWSL